MHKGAIFDIDGTLLDSMPIWENSSATWLAGIGVKAEENLNDVMFRLSLDEGAAYIKTAYGLSESEEEIKAGIIGVISDFYINRAQAKAGVPGFLAHLAELEIPMYLATSSNREHVKAALSRLGLYSYFDGLITCEEAGASKREPKIFLMAAERMGLAPEDIFVFEDVIHAVRSANSAGFVTVGVYDAASGADNEAMRAECGIYLHTLENWEEFYKYLMVPGTINFL